MKIEIPGLSLIALIGASASGKTTFAKKHFKPTQVLSSDVFRAMVSDDEENQDVTADAFRLLYDTAAMRLKNGRLTVIDATNVNKEDRKGTIRLAKEHDVHAAAIVLNLPTKELLSRNSARTERQMPEKVIHSQDAALRKSIKNLKKEGFRFVYVLDNAADIDNAEIVYTRLWNDKRDEHAPLDIIGDVHGCVDELKELLEGLGYKADKQGGYSHPESRKVVFLGDLCDRGDGSMEVLRLVMAMVGSGNAYCVRGNHDDKLLRYLKGHNVKVTHGMGKTVEGLENENEAFREEVKVFLDRLISHYVFDDGRIAVSHAGLKAEYIGRASARVREFCLYGDTTGETDEYGLPVRLDWAEDYRGKTTVVYGHTPQPDVRNVNNTFCIDTGCVFGGKLTAFRYPEKELISVEAHRRYYEPVRPLETDADGGDIPDIADVSGKLYLTTELFPSITVREENSVAALEVMSRYAADPHWLIYLPPTMSPCETSELEDYLEHPLEAFEYFRKNGVDKVVCEKKHMGSRAVIVLCHTAETAGKRFGVRDGGRGIIYTRTGRSFFADKTFETAVLDRLDAQLEGSGFWSDFNTDWVCLDTELMPWSEKAAELLRTQYGPVGRAGKEGLAAAAGIISAALERYFTDGENIGDDENDADLDGLLKRVSEKQESMDAYIKAYREYCWSVGSVDDLRIAPFHLLACEGKVFSDKDHIWHMETLKKYCVGTDPLFMATDYTVVDTADNAQIEEGVKWWLALTGNGGEGMVVKPYAYAARYKDRLVQPAVKCRGREYLRIIYGPEYLMEGHLERLKQRSLSRKRSLALKEFALGLEALNRFVDKEPLYRVHECVFGVLAMESEPTDPRL